MTNDSDILTRVFSVGDLFFYIFLAISIILFVATMYLLVFHYRRKAATTFTIETLDEFSPNSVQPIVYGRAPHLEDIPASKALMALTKEYSGSRALTAIHWKSVLLVMLHLTATCAAIMFSSTIERLDPNTNIFAVFIWFTPLVIIVIARIFLCKYEMVSRFMLRQLQYNIIAALGVIEVAIFLIFFWEGDNSLVNWETAIYLILSGWVIAFFSGRIMRDTEYRTISTGKLLGIRDFIKNASAADIATLSANRPTLFEDIMPFAEQFKIAETWKKKNNR